MPLITECIGLDVGTSAIKAVRVRRTLGHRDTVTCFESALPVTADRAATRALADELLREFVRRHRLDATTVITALPCRDLVIRTLALPFRDIETLGRVVPFEMEGALPFPLEEVALDYFPLPPPEGEPEHNGTEVPNLLVAAVPKATLAAHFDRLAAAGVAPAAVNVDALALFSVTRYLAALSNGASGLPPDFMLTDIGASKTTLCLVHRGRPIVLRTIHHGGDELTEGLAQKHGCGFEEAESLKRASTADQLEPWLNPLVKELRLALHAYEAQTSTRLRSYWLCGGSAKLNGINAHLERHLDLEPIGNGHGFGHLCPPTFSIAFGLAVRGAQRATTWSPLKRLGRSQAVVALDFKRALEPATREPRETRRDLWLAGLGAVLVAVLALGDLWIQVAVRETHVRQLAAALQGQYRQQFGAEAPPGEEVDLARRKLDDARKTLAFLQGNQSLVLPVLAELVRRAPGAGSLKIQAVTIENETVSLEAETNSFESVDKFKQQLAGSALFQNVVVSDAHVGMSPNQVLFRAALTVKPL
jgi:general secretion pathway protein L